MKILFILFLISSCSQYNCDYKYDLEYETDFVEKDLCEFNELFCRETI